MASTTVPRRSWRSRLYRLRKRVREGSLAHRFLTALAEHHPWYDWGARVMIFVGQHRTGSYEPPRGRDVWYREIDRRPGSRRQRFQTTHDYSDVRADVQAGVGDWKIFDVQDEGGTVMLGYYGADRISFYGLDRGEMRLFRRWDFWECRVRGEWLGLRRWLYYRALHAHVDIRKPFACKITPPPGSGGYRHWHCELRGKHDVHRFRNYTWARGTARVEYEPVQ